MIEESVQTEKAIVSYQHQSKIVVLDRQKKKVSAFHSARVVAQLTAFYPHRKAIKVNTGRVVCCLKDWQKGYSTKKVLLPYLNSLKKSK